MRKFIRSASVTLMALLAIGLAYAPAATAAPNSAGTAVLPNASTELPRTLPSDGWFRFEDGPDGFASRGSATSRVFSGEFKASVDGSKFWHSGGVISSSTDAWGCTPGYSTVKVQLVRTVGGVVTWMSTAKSIPCAGGAVAQAWGTHTAGTYNLFFTRSGPAFSDENWKSVSGTISYFS